MPFIGTAPNKTHQRTDGTRTGAQTWQEADAAGVDIISPDHDTHDQDFSDSLSSCFLRDGGNTATANLPMGGFRFTNLGDAAAPTQALTLKQHASNKGQYCTVGGTANAITLTTGFTLTAYEAGQSFTFIVGSTNTGATTVNIDSLGVKSLVRSDGSNTALSSGDLVAGSMVEIQYDGTRFHLRSSSLTSASGDVLARIVKAGSIMAWPHATVPAGWLECYGQAISRTTYAELFANIDTTFGVGDGSTTFNLPDLRGRSIFGEDDMGGTSADRLTGLTNGINGDTLGATGGLESLTIAQANLPNVNFTGTTSSDGDHTHTLPKRDFADTGSSDGTRASEGSTNGATDGSFTLNTTGAHTHAVTVSSGGSGTALNNLPPGMVLKWIILALPATAAAGTLGVHGLQYAWSTATSGDPGSGTLLVNNATLASATAINISETDANSANVAAWLATWDDSTSTTKGYIHIAKVGAPGDFMIYAVSGSLTDSGAYDTLTISHVASNGTFASGVNVSVLFYRTGDKGETGATGATGASGVDAGVRYNFDSTTTMADPGTGDIRLNNATLSSVTAIAVSDLTAETGNPDASAFVLAWDDSTNTSLRGTIVIKKISAAQNFAIYSITGASTDNVGWTQLAVTHVASAGSFTAADALSVAFSRTGDVGATGTAGTIGTDAGARWLFDSATTTTVDPGTGDFRLNNATLASVTEIAISYSCGETGNPSLENWVKAWDDSTTTGNRGTLILKKVSAPQNIAIYSITSTITDGTTYGRFTLSHVASAGSFANTDTLSVQFIRTGDKGADGAGAGDVTAAANFGTDNVLVRSDGTLKGVQSTGIVVADTSNDMSSVGSITPAAGSGIRTATSDTNTLLLQAYDVDGAAYTTFGTLTAGNTPTFELDNTILDTAVAKGTWTASGTWTIPAVTLGGAVALNGQSFSGTCANGGTMTTIDINGGTIDGAVIGGASAAAATVTTLTTTGAIELGHATANTLSGSSGDAFIEGTVLLKGGEHTVNLLSAGMVSRTTNGPTLFTTEKATNDVMVRGYEFNAGTEQAIQIAVPLPKGYNSTPGLVVKFYWTTSATAGTGNVVWGFKAKYSRDDDAIDAAFGTAVEVTDGFLLDGDTHVSAETSACTPGGTFGSECMLRVEVYRKAADAADTYTQTAILEAVMVSLPINASNDA